MSAVQILVKVVNKEVDIFLGSSKKEQEDMIRFLFTQYLKNFNPKDLERMLDNKYRR